MPDDVEPTSRDCLRPSHRGDGEGQGHPAIRQPALPQLASLVTPVPRWAHPFERDFAVLLDRYRIRWSYEPTTFLVSRRLDGSPGECFTPDFYLPDLRTYVELTSMRQALVTRKHRKLRRFRDVSPGTRVVMLYRRDYHRILSAWAGSGDAAAAAAETPGLDGAVTLPPGGRLLYGAVEVEQRLARIALAIADRYAGLGEEPLLVGLGAGGRRVADDLARRLDRRDAATVVDTLSIEARPGVPGVVGRTGVTLSGRTVTLVPALVSTGLTVEFAAGWLRRRGTAAVDVCALLDRASARVVPVPLPYGGLPAPVQHLVGYGLELRQQFRGLPGIAVYDAPYDDPVAAFDG